jgi:hypothetical protein
VPAETARLQRRLAGRDRRFLTAVVAAVVLGTPAGVVLAERHAKPPLGCVRRLERGFMGGQTVTTCHSPARTGRRDVSNMHSSSR